MYRAVYDRIIETIGSRKPECGGILGAGADGIVSEFYFDETGRSEPDAYIPDVEAVNRVLCTWHEQGIHMVGIVHSHREGLIAPSCGDIAYGMQILDALDMVEKFYLPILTRKGDGVRLDGYVVLQEEQSAKCKTMGICVIE